MATYATIQALLEDYARWGIEHARAVRGIGFKARELREKDLDPTLGLVVQNLLMQVTRTLGEGRVFLRRSIEAGNALGANMPSRDGYREPSYALMVGLTDLFCETCISAAPIEEDYSALDNETLIETLALNYNTIMKLGQRAVRHQILQLEVNGWESKPLSRDHWLVLMEGLGSFAVSFSCVAETVTHFMAYKKDDSKTETELRFEMADKGRLEVVGYGFNRQLCVNCEPKRISV